MANDRQITRVIRSKEAARASYDRLSRWYDALAAGSEQRFREAGLRALDTGEGECVLEVGCGTGHALVALAQSVGRSGAIYGLDISAGMAGVSRGRVRRAGVLDRVYLVCGDGARAPLATAHFDAIFMSFTLELFDTPEIPTVLSECGRLLRDHGRLCIVSLSKRAGVGFPWAVDLYERLHRAFPAALDCRPIYVREAVQEAGYRLVDTTEMAMWGLPVEVVLAEWPGDAI
jgi:demethylmenaquinone methyltransferase/2-methoxy-6-polyprenyl-1,4-benzoquinol methylase